MLGIALLIGPIVASWNTYWRLAEKYGRSKVGYAFLGVGVYIGALLLLGVAVALILEFTAVYPSTVLTGFGFDPDLLFVLFGGACTWLVYFFLKKNWKKHARTENDSGLLDDEPFQQNT